jgi:hypothetical protein
MKRLGAVLVVIVVAVTLCAAATALAGPRAMSMVNGTAWTYDPVITQQDRMTSIQARMLPGGGATGAVRVIKREATGTQVLAAEVRDLAIEDGWAYFVLYDSVTACYWYLVAYDGSSFGGVDEVSYLWIPDSGPPGEEEIRALFDARWRQMDEAWMPVLRGGFKFR